MKDVLSKMYHNIYDTDVLIKGGLCRIINRAEKIFCKKLKGKYKKLFYNYEAAHSENCAIVAEESFKKGFKSGMEFERELREL